MTGMRNIGKLIKELSSPTGSTPQTSAARAVLWKMELQRSAAAEPGGVLATGCSPISLGPLLLSPPLGGSIPCGLENPSWLLKGRQPASCAGIRDAGAWSGGFKLPVCLQRQPKGTSLERPFVRCILGNNASYK